MNKQQIEKKIAELHEKTTGDLLNDMDVMDEIHKLKMLLNDVEAVCNLDDDDCLFCGS